MTREEAIEVIKLAMAQVEWDYPMDYAAAFDMAIKALEQEPTTKNDLGVDWESYKDADGNSLDYLILNVLQNSFDCGDAYGYTIADKIIGLLSSVTPQEPQIFKWCTDCREYDQEKHCCHRWSKVIRDTVEEMKQEYIEREVLDKIRAQIKSNLRGVEIALEVLVENHPLRPKMEGAKDTLEDCLEIIDKAESEEI